MISVIVPVYNVEKYLVQCIDSILAQRHRDLEVILVDDGSTDGCPGICDSYAKKDIRVKVVHKKNEGLVCARKTGLRQATGEYIAYVDGDDWVEPDMYGQMYRIARQQDVDVVMCGRYEDTGTVSKEARHGLPEGRYGKGRLLREVYPEMIAKGDFFEWRIFPSVCDKLFRRGCLEPFQMAVDGRIRMGEDAACVYPCLLNAGSIYVMNGCLYHYRQSPGSMVRKIQGSAEERRQFLALHQSVSRSLEAYAHIHDLRGQWLKYMLLLMVLRADGLLEGHGDLDYLFPFPGIKKGSAIVLYGAGIYGQRLHRWLADTGFCRVAAWVDRNYREFRGWGLPVDPPGILEGLAYDAIAIANTYARSRHGLYQDLIKKTDKGKVHMIDEGLIFSEESVRRFGLV